MSKKSPIKKPKEPIPKTIKELEPIEPSPIQEAPSELAASTPEPSPPLTLESLHQQLEALKLTVEEFQLSIARKRRPPVTNSKVQIIDKQTGEIYPSKNNAYQTLLKSGALSELVDKGIFGDIPAKNTFGWYVLIREWPDRFQEVPVQTQS